MAVETLHPAGGDRSGVQEFQKRPGTPSDLPFGATASGGTHFCLFPGLWPACDLAPEIECAGAGTDPARGARNHGRGSDAGFGVADQRWTLAGDEPLHAAGKSGATIAGATANEVARATAAALERATQADIVSGGRAFVVKTFAFGASKTPANPRISVNRCGEYRKLG